MKIAIVEDNHTESDLVLSYISRFEKENNQKIESVVSCDGLAFLDKYDSDFDAVFMDIEMLHLFDNLGKIIDKVRNVGYKNAYIMWYYGKVGD